jgi:D-glycero-D-manno-heptose 1,7-bisphosphate phosphatase
MSDPHHRLLVAESAVKGLPALLVDRDGTLIEERDYLSDPAQVRLLPGAATTLRRFRDAGHALVLVTNQSGVGRGYFDWAVYETVASALREQLAAEGVTLDAEAVCGHAPADACDWRKPQPGMISAAGQALQLDLRGSVMVGDKLSDLQAANTAGVGRLVHVASGHGAAERAAVLASGLKVVLLDALAELTP